MNIEQNWGSQYIINYFWQKTMPDYKDSGKGAFYYDAKLQCFAVHNIYEGGNKELRYILNVNQKMSYIVTIENKLTSCKKYPTDRKLLPISFLEDSLDLGSSNVFGENATLFQYDEKGHDNWLWCVDSSNKPLRYFTVTHQGTLQVLHDVSSFEPNTAPDPKVFEIPEGC